MLHEINHIDDGQTLSFLLTVSTNYEEISEINKGLMPFFGKWTTAREIYQQYQTNLKEVFVFSDAKCCSGSEQKKEERKKKEITWNTRESCVVSF